MKTKPFCRTLGKGLFYVLFLFLSSLSTHGQTLATVGDDFWLGFMNNTGSSNEELRLFVTSQVATSGTVDIPQQGWSTNFTVVPNVTTTIVVPLAFGETLTQDVVDGKGIHVTSNDDISLFAINFSIYSADASKILPSQSLGTEYLVSAYRGISNINRSELLIVATEDNTEIEITPSVTTQGGFTAGVPYLVNLNQGECYQVRSAATTGDLTGTRISGTLQSGDCRPFAVFAGAQCANVPTTCTTCDHLFDQQVPIYAWGTEYYMPPFESTGVYTYRVLANENNTQVSVDGGALQTLNAGQFIEINNEVQPRQITSDKVIQVIQLMQGDNCSSNGDPAMLVLNPQDQKISNVTFSTVASSVITSHYLNIVVETSDIGTVLLDNTPISAGIFTPFPSNPAASFAKLPVTQGSHNIFSPNGFTAYLYGMGTAESYAYSLGAYKEEQPIIIDSVICADTALLLVPPISLFQPQWYAMSDSSQIVSTSNSLALNNPPHITDLYVVEGVSPISGCPDSYTFSIASPGSVGVNMTLSEDTVCSFENVFASAAIADTGFYEYQWNPSYMYSSPNSDSTVIVPFVSGFYSVTVQNVGGGCVTGSDSMYIHVIPSNIQGASIIASDTLLCLPDTANLQANVNEIVFIEEFNGVGISPLWASSVGGILSNSCGAISGNAFLFNTGPTREIETQDFDVSNGGTVQFYLKVATGAAPCDDAELGEDILLEYSIDGGVSWLPWTTLFEFNYPVGTLVDLPIPIGAQTSATRFRWIQPNFTGINEDVWWLDNVIVTSLNSGTVNYNWTPSANLTAPNGAVPSVIPTSASWYVLEVGSGACSYTDSVYIDISEPFTVDLIQDTVLCGNQQFNVQAAISGGSNQTIVWEPAGVFTSINGSTATVGVNIDTTLYVTVTSPDGCFAEIDSATVLNQYATVTLSGNTNMCLGSSQVLSATVNSNATNTIIEWFESGVLIGSASSTQTVSPSSSSWYHVVVSDPVSGCSWSDSIFITVLSFTVDAGPDTTLCLTQGYQIPATTSAASGIYSWTNSGMLSNSNVLSPVITQNATGTYILTVSNGGCSFSDTVTITYNSPVVPYIPEDTTICEGEFIQLDMGNATSINWIPNTGVSSTGNSYSFQPTSSTIYSTSFTSSNGCAVLDTMTVNIIPLPQVNLMADTTLCPGTLITIQANATPAGGIYSWNTNQTTPSITVNSQGLYSVSYTTGCGVAMDSVQVAYFPDYNVSLGDDTTVCIGDTLLFQPTVPPGGSLIWSNGTSSPTYISTNAETLFAIVNDGNGCFRSDTIVITNHPLIQSNLTSSVAICDGSSVTLDASAPQGVSYLWNTNETSSSITVTQGGAYSVTIEDAFGCSIEEQIQVAILSLPTPTINGPVSYCSNEATVFSVNGSYAQYQWSTGGNSSSTSISGVFNEISVTVTDINGCEGVDTLYLSPIVVPELNLGPDIVLCDTATTVLDGTVPGATGYLWSPNGLTAPAIDVLPGVYSLNVSYQTCSIQDTIVISVEPYILNLGQDQIVCKDDELVIVQSMNNIDSLLWYDGSTGGWLILPTEHLFEDSIFITATAYGCDVQQDTLKIILEDCNCDFYVPNSFTPNNDGMNELFRVYQDCPVSSFEIQLFNRWGEVVFESADVNFVWDGRGKSGEQVQDGTYTWQIRFATEYLDEVHYREMHGHLNILK